MEERIHIEYCIHRARGSGIIDHSRESVKILGGGIVKSPLYHGGRLSHGPSLSMLKWERFPALKENRKRGVEDEEPAQLVHGGH